MGTGERGGGEGWKGGVVRVGEGVKGGVGGGGGGGRCGGVRAGQGVDGGGKDTGQRGYI